MFEKITEVWWGNKENNCVDDFCILWLKLQLCSFSSKFEIFWYSDLWVLNMLNFLKILNFLNILNQFQNSKSVLNSFWIFTFSGWRHNFDTSGKF